MEKIRFGVIGSDCRGMSILRDSLLGMPDVAVVAF